MENFENKVIEYLSGELQENEVDTLLKEIDEDEFKKQFFEKTKKAWEFSQISNDYKTFDKDKAFQSFSNSIKNKQSKNLFVNKWIRVAAIMLVLVSLSVAYYSVSEITLFSKIEKNNISTSNKIYAVSAPIGKKLKVTLPDGSEVRLNSLSTLTYKQSFNENNREISLVGEAFFDVKKNPSKPFIVKTKNCTAKVLGTSFNVSAFENCENIKIWLKTGSLMINEKVKMKPNELAVVASDSSQILIQHDEKDYSQWWQNVLIFQNDNLAEACKKIERYFNVKINVDSNIQNYVVTATFKNSKIEEVLMLFEKINPIEIKKNEQDEYIAKRDNKRFY